MATYNKLDSFVDALSKKLLHLGTDTLKVGVTNTAPVRTNTQYSNLVDLSTANGYTAGGATTAQTLSNASGTEKLVCADVVISATGAVGPFRYAYLYDFTATNKDLIGWWDYGSSVTLANGETFTIDFDATNGVFTLV